MMPEDIRSDLLVHADAPYAAFQRGIIPEIAKERIIGVRLPQIRALSRKIKDPIPFLNALPHRYLEEDLLHGILLADLTDYDTCRAWIGTFLPYIDNWAVCDLPTPAILAMDLSATAEWIESLLHKEHPYSVRYGILLLMRLYLPSANPLDAMSLVAALEREEPCIVKAAGWFFATALTLHPDKAAAYFLPGRLFLPIYRMAWKKARESRAIPLTLLTSLRDEGERLKGLENLEKNEKIFSKPIDKRAEV